MEACNDTPHGKLTEEVGELKNAIKELEAKLVESSEALKDLQANKVLKMSSLKYHTGNVLIMRSAFVCD